MVEKLAFTVDSSGEALDPVAYMSALEQDERRMAALAAHPEVISAIKNKDVEKFKEFLKEAQKERKQYDEHLKDTMFERSLEAQRASATLPRDTVSLYSKLKESGLEYGPSFRLLRNVHVPDPVDAELLSQP
eukprot:TRINITY_DN20307_c0_g1_i11.p3 TRINITY_DN20307_c0_g1~~TRINITY_DN20307_c0_g1_i11.p3  ORF type:complete len:132 (+),score=28.93 TRINITY_DN20307_c0_g1_i11:76-471(+)